MSNSNAAAALLVTVAILTGMAHLHGTPARRHATARHWSSPERVELGDAKIPIMSVRTGPYDRTPHRRSSRVYQNTSFQGKAAVRRKDVPDVIVGYVDPDRGPRAFHRLTRVVEGDRVKVVRRDHTVSWFRVDSVRRVARLEAVRESGEERPDLRPKLRSDLRPELRLVSRRDSPAAERAGDTGDTVVLAHLDRPGR